MRETQATIVAWVATTFGNTSTPMRMFARTHEEMAELLAKATGGATPSEIVEEAADTAICLKILCDKLDCKAMALKGSGMVVEYQAAPVAELAAMANYHLAQAMLWYATEKRVAVHTVASLQNAYTALWMIPRAFEDWADLDVQIDLKMAINRLRKWTVDASGCGYHVDEAHGS